MLCIKAWLGAWLPGTWHPALDTCIRAIQKGGPEVQHYSQPQAFVTRALWEFGVGQVRMQERLPCKLRLRTTLTCHARIARDLSLSDQGSEVWGSAWQWSEVLTCHTLPYVVFLLSKSFNLLIVIQTMMHSQIRGLETEEATHHTLS